MKIIFCLLLTMVLGCTQRSKSSIKIESNDPQSQNTFDTFNINALYIAENPIPPVSILEGFSYTHSKSKNEVQVVSTKKIGGIVMQFIILYEDSLNIYKEDDFFSGDLNFPIKESYFKINGIKYMINNSSEIEVANIWFGGTEYKSVKFYKVRNSSYILIHGIDLFCNGRQCTEHTIFAISISNKGKAVVKCFKFVGIHPYYFENVELVNPNRPFIFLPKNGIEQVSNVTDFEKHYLQ